MIHYRCTVKCVSPAFNVDIATVNHLCFPVKPNARKGEGSPERENQDMEFANKMATLATRAVNNDTVVNVFLGACFVALGVRSVNQQKDIEALESEKDSLVKANKAMKEAMWSWKQQLFSEATDAADSALVPLSRLKAIYGEAPTQLSGDAVKNEAKSLASKFVV